MTRIAVIDVETTGLRPFGHDRIIEMAAIIARPDGSVLNRFETLINPERDIGPIHIHGLTTEDVLNAPKFSEVIGPLIETLDGCVALAGHNVRFDVSFLAAEFSRLGLEFPQAQLICTMNLCGGGSLELNCANFGLPFTGRTHSAGDDALATCRLLGHLLEDVELGGRHLGQGQNIVWPAVPPSTFKPVVRGNPANAQHEKPEFLRRLTDSPRFRFGLKPESEVIQNYLHLLSDVLEDRVIDASEGEALLEFAQAWQLSVEQTEDAHRKFLLQLAKQAWADGIVTEAEQRDLNRVAALLGVGSDRLAEIQDTAYSAAHSGETSNRNSDDWYRGLKVCFTGECQCLIDGERITRERCFALAEAHGIVVTKGVTKSLDILVVADPLTQSGKAKKARQYGIRIMQARVFWRAIGLEVE